MAHMSRVESLGFRSIQSKLGCLVDMRYMSGLMAHSRSMRRMEMALIRHSMKRWMVRNSRGQQMILHNSQSKQLLLVCMNSIHLLMVHSSNMKHMEMALQLGYMIQLMARMSRVQSLVHSSSLSRLLGLARMTHIRE